MLENSESVAAIEKDSGKYDWIIGNDVNIALSSLEKQTTEIALKNLVWWTKNALNQDVIYKESLIK
jgi:uncharacterized linocin/CFP29 family protein